MIVQPHGDQSLKQRELVAVSSLAQSFRLWLLAKVGGHGLPHLPGFPDEECAQS